MSRLKVVAPVVLVCLFAARERAFPLQAATSPLLGILQAELQRNYQVLRKEPAPAYFIAYTVHDQQSTFLDASNGAMERNDDQRSRFATIEVRVGDYTVDNTHPLRGDGGGTNPRLPRVALPLTDEDKPI